ncbi:MAG: DNA primase, partial [Candidatus Omnitrophica bacterium]|nr:DNA primase [Candidatus Omnitrophota bacterium]
MSKERYSPEVIDNIRSMVSLPYIVQRYTHLNRHGTGLCPFHTERHPSFSVNAKKGLWHCFGCGAGGDIFDFVMRAENLTFPNAVKLLAFETGIRLPESDSVKEIISKRWQEKHKRLN